LQPNTYPVLHTLQSQNGFQRIVFIVKDGMVSINWSYIVNSNFVQSESLTVPNTTTGIVIPANTPVPIDIARMVWRKFRSLQWSLLNEQ